MLSQTIRSELDSNTPAASDADQIYVTAREMTRAMDEIVWAVNPKHDTLDSLVTYLGRFAQHFLSAAGIRCRLDVPLNLTSSPITTEVRHNLFLAFKEALNNVVKHAHASEAGISLEMNHAGFTLLVADNGCGFDSEELLKARDGGRPAGGNGLANMRKRMDEIGGTCEWESSSQKGTRVRFRISIQLN
jgi:signal transduction histidine kinase